MMSNHKMCTVPTESGDVKVPVGTVILLDDQFVGVADDGGYQGCLDDIGDGHPLPYDGRTATIIAIPDGNGVWTAPNAVHPECDVPTDPTEGVPMSITDENVTTTADRDRTPDPFATIEPFRHPWVAGDASCGECGETFREHWWVDAGDHGHTVCRLPEHTTEWVALTPEQVALLPDRTPVRVEAGGVITEGPLHREMTSDNQVYLYYKKGRFWAGTLPNVTVHVRSQDVPADPETELIERAAKAVYETRFHAWDLEDESRRDIYRQQARAALNVFRGEQA